MLDPPRRVQTGIRVIALDEAAARSCRRSWLRGALVSTDLVEVSPPLDLTGSTVIAGGQSLFEVLRLLADAAAARRD